MRASNLIISLVVIAAVFLGGAYFGGMFSPPSDPPAVEGGASSG